LNTRLHPSSRVSGNGNFGSATRSRPVV